jgi:hypothetical protein
MESSQLKSLLASILNTAKSLLEDISRLRTYVHFKRKHWHKTIVGAKPQQAKMVPVSLISRFKPAFLANQQDVPGRSPQNVSSGPGVAGKNMALPATSLTMVSAQAITPPSAGPVNAVSGGSHTPGAVPSAQDVSLDTAAIKKRRRGGRRNKERAV